MCHWADWEGAPRRFKLQECMGKLSELGFSWHLAERAARGAGADAGLAAQLLLDGTHLVLFSSCRKIVVNERIGFKPHSWSW